MGEGGASPGVLPLDDLAAAIERFTGSPRVDRTPDALADELTQLRHLIDHLEVRFSQTSAEFAQTNAWEDWGSVSPIQWIRYECKMGGGAAADRVCVGEQLARLPLSSQALADGQIGFAHMAVLARTAEALTSSDTAKGFDEQLVLNEAKTLSVGRLWRFCHHVRHAADPKGFAADEADAVERRRLQLSPCEDGSLLVDGWLDSAGGAALRTALEPLARPAGAEDDRCRERRLADALVELATHALDAGLVPQRAGQRPHLQVTTTLETLRGLAGSPAGELEFSLPISATTVQRLACDSTITRVVLGSQSVVIDVGRASGSSPGPPGVPWMREMDTASGRDVTGRPPGARRITSCIGPAVARPICPTWCSYVTAITGWLTKAAGNSSGPMTDDCSRSLQSQDGFRRCALPATSRRPNRPRRPTCCASCSGPRTAAGTARGGRGGDREG